MTPARETYEKISRKASRLMNLISDTMDEVRGPGTLLPPEWDELHEMMQLAHVIACQAGRYRDRAAVIDKPIDYTLAEGLRDLDAAAHDPFTYQSPSGPRDFTDLF